MKKRFDVVSGFKVKSITEDSDTITIEGYANTTSKDRVGDVIVESAWQNGGLDNYLKNPIVLAYHDHTKPIGTVVDYGVDAKGLRIVAEVVKASGDIFNLIAKNILKSFSVGFRVTEADYDQATDTFVIKNLELLEVSVVSVPANADSTFSVRKAFDDTEEYQEFKKSFEKGEVTNVTEPSSADRLKELEEKLLESVNSSSEKLLEQIAEKLEIKEKKMTVEVKESGVEKLVAELTKRMEDQEKSFSSVLDGLRDEIKAKSAEIEAITNSKMHFEDKGGVPLSAKEVDKAVLLAKSLGRRIEDTAYGKQLIEKAGAHLASMTADWEQEFSTRLEEDIRQRLIMEPLFRGIPMNTASMQIPVNPEAGYGEWIAAGSYRSTDGSSTGTAVDHKPTDTTLTAHKLVAKEYLGYEEEEDSILPLMPIVQDAITRRMGKAADRALLRGDAAQATGDGDTYPFNGVATMALDASTQTTLSIGAGAQGTVSGLQEARKGLGVWGLDPKDVIYVVSTDYYYDLLEDPDFRTIDMVGANATILTGQIGFANGSPVVVSGEFAAKAANAHCAVAINTRNFVVGNLRNTMVERDRNIEDQKNILVASRRVGFLDLISAKGSSVVTWVA